MIQICILYLEVASNNVSSNRMTRLFIICILVRFLLSFTTGVIVSPSLKFPNC